MEEMTTRTNDIGALPIGVEQPRLATNAVANQKLFQWVNNTDFYSIVPAPFYAFYQNWVRLWLYWYDGYVPWIHGGAQGILSTNIGTTLVNRAADQVFGGNLMFSNSRKPKIIVEKEGKPIGAALDFITNNWTKNADFRMYAKKAIRYAFAGGFSLLKLNNAGGELWLDALRADRFFVDLDARNNLRKVVAISSIYENMTPKKEGSNKRYVLCEERRYEKLGMLNEEIPVVEYKIYETSTPINYFTAQDNCVQWNDLPRSVRDAFRREYDGRLNEPKALNGFTDLGCYLLRGSDGVSNVPQIGLGESLLSNILTYLFEYDFYNTCFNTDMYLARGRVLVPKYMQSPQAIARARQTQNNYGIASSANEGLDSFLYTKVESPNPDAQKPEAIQFSLRAAEWKEARNLLLESMATGIGISVSTLASYISDGSNRTAREVSAEESATTLFVENARRRFEKPINSLLKAVLRFYGYIDDVELRWSRAGMTNVTVLVDTLAKAKQAGLISPEAAHAAYNFDNDEEQNDEDFAKVKEAEERQNNTLFGGDTF